MNDKMRFIVLTTLMIVAFPLTIESIFILWLIGELKRAQRDYAEFYRSTWGGRNGQ